MPLSTGTTDDHTARDGDAGLVLVAERIFDGQRVRRDAAVLIRGRSIADVGIADDLATDDLRTVDLGDATVLPGVIDLHVHISFQKVPYPRVIAHGVTTVRDLAGSITTDEALPGELRYTGAGPMLTVPGGYPIPVFGTKVALPVRGPKEARAAVRNVVSRGASVIKLSLEPGLVKGAPWTRRPSSTVPWPMPSVEVIRAVVDEAHEHSLLVTAHLSEKEGVRLALEGGVDEWAHVPGERIEDELLEQAVEAGVTIVGTLHTLAYCPGVMDNARAFVSLGGRLLYGTDMAHLEIPHGIDAQELQFMADAGMSRESVLAAATSDAGKQLGLAPLGSLIPGAPADLIAVRGDGVEDFKRLEHPDLVLSSGSVVVDEFGTVA